MWRPGSIAARYGIVPASWPLSVNAVSGYSGGRIDAFIMRAADVQLSFPAILIALLVFGIGRGLIHPSQHEQMAVVVLIIAIGLSHWAQYARTVRDWATAYANGQPL